METDATRDALFERLVDRNKRRLVSIARSYATGDEYQDLYQEMLLQVWRSLDRFEGRSSADTWIYRIALNTALTYRRRSDPRLRHTASPDEAVEAARSPGAAASTTELDLLRQFIGSLGDVDRAVFLLYLEDLSYREMAEILGMSETNVGVRINRLKKTFIARYC